MQRTLEQGRVLCALQARTPILQESTNEDQLPQLMGTCETSRVGLGPNDGALLAATLGPQVARAIYLHELDRLIQGYAELIYSNKNSSAPCKAGLQRLLAEARILRSLPSPAPPPAPPLVVAHHAEEARPAPLPQPLPTATQRVAQSLQVHDPRPAPQVRAEPAPLEAPEARPRSASLPLAAALETIQPPSLPVETLATADAASEQWPPDCAVQSFAAEMEARSDRYSSRSWLGRQFQNLIGNGRPQMSAVRAQPQLVFLSLSDTEQRRHMRACDLAPTTSNLGSTSLQLPPRQQVRVAENPAAWPPVCALETMRNLAVAAEQNYNSRTWLGRLWSRNSGGPSREMLAKMVSNPREVFLSLSEEQKQTFLTGCIPPLPGVPAPQRDPAKNPLAGIAPLAAWPPACAVDAFRRDLDAFKRQAESDGWLERNLRRGAGVGTPNNLQSLLRDPASSFVILAPEAQTSYLNQCSPPSMRRQADPPGFFARLRARLLGMGTPGKIALVLAAALGGALLWRIRGGFLPTGSTQLARLIGVLPLALMGGLLGGPWGFAAGASMFLTTSLIGWGAFYRTQNAGQAAAMTLRGLFQTGLPGALLAQAPGQSPLYALAGLGMGPIYLASNTLAAGIQIGARAGFVTGATDLAELATGALLYGSFAAMLLFGADPSMPPLPAFQRLF